MNTHVMGLVVWRLREAEKCLRTVVMMKALRVGRNGGSGWRRGFDAVHHTMRSNTCLTFSN